MTKEKSSPGIGPRLVIKAKVHFYTQSLLLVHFQPTVIIRLVEAQYCKRNLWLLSFEDIVNECLVTCIEELSTSQCALYRSETYVCLLIWWKRNILKTMFG